MGDHPCSRASATMSSSDEDTAVVIDGRRGWLVDLRGRPVEPFDGSFPLRPWGIATAQLDC